MGSLPEEMPSHRVIRCFLGFLAFLFLKRTGPSRIERHCVNFAVRKIILTVWLVCCVCALNTQQADS